VQGRASFRGSGPVRLAAVAKPQIKFSRQIDNTHAPFASHPLPFFLFTRPLLVIFFRRCYSSYQRLTHTQGVHPCIFKALKLATPPLLQLSGSIRTPMKSSTSRTSPSFPQCIFVTLYIGTPTPWYQPSGSIARCSTVAVTLHFIIRVIVACIFHHQIHNFSRHLFFIRWQHLSSSPPLPAPKKPPSCLQPPRTSTPLSCTNPPRPFPATYPTYPPWWRACAT
jgi:hypothetical protein